MTSIRTYRARWVLPITGPPIRDGHVTIDGESGRVVDCGRDDPCGPVVDLGDAAILPRPINAHTHLEFSDFGSPVGDPGTPLHDWIGQVVARRFEKTSADRDAAIAAGLKELATAQTDLACEIATTRSSLYADGDGGLVIPMAEVLGLSESRNAGPLAFADQLIGEFPHAGICPHAPYSTSWEAIGACVELARRSGRLLAMHVAESPAERELIESGRGPFCDALSRLGAWRNGLFPWPGRGLPDLIETLAGAPRSILVHGNDFRPEEIEAIAKHHHLSVVYCPRTHHFFGYEPHPVQTLLAAGVRVALGTDSRASNPDLDVIGEVAWLLNHRQDIAPKRVLAMVTRHAADALGRTDRGRIEPGLPARLATFATNANTEAALWQSLAEGARLRSLLAG